MVMDYDAEKKDEKGFATAQTMRDEYQDLKARIEVTDEYILNKQDAARLLIGAVIQINQLQDRINNLKKAMAGFQSDVVPKLQEVVDAETDEAAQEIANKKFIIENNE
jgi:hypothetical protein